MCFYCVPSFLRARACVAIGGTAVLEGIKLLLRVLRDDTHRSGIMFGNTLITV